jgi:hypothetical protein
LPAKLRAVAPLLALDADDIRAMCRTGQRPLSIPTRPTGAALLAAFAQDGGQGCTTMAEISAAARNTPFPGKGDACFFRAGAFRGHASAR